jgi:hypothetical protein
MEDQMADNSGGNSFIGVLVGALLVAVVALGVYAYNGGLQTHRSVEVHLQAPNVNLPSTPNVTPPTAPTPTPAPSSTPSTPG